ncbi:MAG TPA: type II toxin-antitoxin system VapC family toxin [Streptosporangiaceae bacterium]|nr:type II toxin-antitoxin system VapC family toxin [Streptosporangiaceae bacterium]
MIYLDSSAAVKLVHAEAESLALRHWLDARVDAPWVSSVLLEIETYRALARHAPAALPRLSQVLDVIDLVGLDAEIRAGAREVGPVGVRSLDAIHLATALRIPGLTAFVAYDARLADAAAAAGLPVEAPASAE